MRGDGAVGDFSRNFQQRGHDGVDAGAVGVFRREVRAARPRGVLAPLGVLVLLVHAEHRLHQASIVGVCVGAVRSIGGRTFTFPDLIRPRRELPSNQRRYDVELQRCHVSLLLEQVQHLVLVQHVQLCVQQVRVHHKVRYPVHHRPAQFENFVDVFFVRHE